MKYALTIAVLGQDMSDSDRKAVADCLRDLANCFEIGGLPPGLNSGGAAVMSNKGNGYRCVLGYDEADESELEAAIPSVPRTELN